MTLCLAFVSPIAGGVVSDRRLTTLTRKHDVVDDDSDKSGIVEFSDGRLAYSFAGLAAVPTMKFSTDMCVAEELCRAGKGGSGTLDALANFAVAMEKRLADLRLSPSDRRLTVVFAGFVRDTAGDDSGVIAVVSNYERLDGLAEAPGKMSVDHEILEPTSGAIRVVGAGSVSQAELESVGEVLQKPINPEAAVQRMVKVIQSSADRNTDKLVGKRCTSAFVARGSDAVAVVDYHVDGTSHKMHYPARVYAKYDDNGAYLTARSHASGFDADGGRIASRVQKVGRNAPCPCGSGDKYKRCHGGVDATSRDFGRGAASVEASTHFMYMQSPAEGHNISIMSLHSGDAS